MGQRAIGTEEKDKIGFNLTYFDRYPLKTLFKS